MCNFLVHTRRGHIQAGAHSLGCFQVLRSCRACSIANETSTERIVWNAPEKMMTGFCQAGSSAIFFRKKNLRCSASRPMKGVPGVMQLESNASGSDPASGSSLARLAAFCRCQASVLQLILSLMELQETKLSSLLEH